MKKHKILMLCDNPLATSGVGCQANHLISGLLKKGRWSFRVLGGAIKHNDYRIQYVNEDYMIKPVDGFGDPNLIRELLIKEKPDAIFLFTDPRFFTWVWQMEEEIHQICPIVYWHVWDNDPYPKFNDVIYQSTDLVNCHSYLTYKLVSEHHPHKTNFIPHALPKDVFKKHDDASTLANKIRILGHDRADHFVCSWVNRNARRKMPGNLMLAWKLLLDRMQEVHGHKKATLLMHTHPSDPEGQNLISIADDFGITQNVIYSTGRISFEEMAVLYNISDFATNIACFPAGELIMTKHGMQKIEDIEIGTEVLTHKGRYRKVVNTWKNQRYNRKVYSIKSTNNNEVRATDNHKIKIIRKSDLPKNWLWTTHANTALDYVSDSKVEDVKVGDYVVYINDNDEFITEYQHINLWDLVKDESINPKQHIDQTVDGTNARFRLENEKIYFNSELALKMSKTNLSCDSNLKIDEDIAYYIGRWNADGSSNTTSIIFNGKELVARQKIIDTLTNKFGGYTCRERNDNARCSDVRLDSVSNAIMTRFFQKYCGMGSENKMIPEFIFTAKESVRRAYLEGHFGGDGCQLTHPQYGNKKNRIRTISNNLARGLKRLLVGLGYVVFMKLDNNGGWGDKKIWTIEWREGNQHGGSNRMWNINGKALVSRVYDIKVDESCNDDIVYNLEVDEDHTYTTLMGTVNNCHEGFGLGTLEAMQCGKPIIALKTGGLTRQVVDHRDGSHNGIALDPDVRDLVGGQTVPYIYEDHVSPSRVADAMWQLFEMGADARAALGEKARNYALSEFDIDHTINEWDRTMHETITKWKHTQRKPWETITL